VSACRARRGRCRLVGVAAEAHLLEGCGIRALTCFPLQLLQHERLL
jgi:hypothetical protein